MVKTWRRKKGEEGEKRRTPDVDVGTRFAAAHVVMDGEEVVVRQGVQSPEFVRAYGHGSRSAPERQHEFSK